MCRAHIDYSGTFDGAGIIAAGPYDCGQGNVIEFATCDIGASLATLEQQAVTWSSQGLIDPISDLAGKPVYVYHGALDPVVNDMVSAAGVDFYQHFGASVEYHSTDPAGNGWPSRTTRRGAGTGGVTTGRTSPSRPRRRWSRS